MDWQYAKRLDGVTGSAIRDIFKLIARPGVISFAGGNPSPSSFEPEIIAEFTARLMRDKGAELLQYGATEGYAPLRESTAQFLRKAGLDAKEEEVVPTSGSTQAIDLCLRALIDPGDVVLAENPTFLGTLQAMQLTQARVKSIETDELGALPESVEELCKEHHPKAVYIIPTFQNPTGRTMPIERRKRMAQLAAQYGFLLMEDDPYRDLRYAGEPLPAIASFDEAGAVVYLTSYSKIISPGLRVGAAVVKDPALRRKLVILKQSADVHTAGLNQALADEYLRSGRMEKHIAEISVGYAKQLDAMLEGIADFPNGTEYTRPEGGLFVWAALPEGFDAAAMLPTIVEEQKVAYVPGTHFYYEKGTHKNAVRLNFSMADADSIRKGMKLLGQAFQR